MSKGCPKSNRLSGNGNRCPKGPVRGLKCYESKRHLQVSIIGLLPAVPCTCRFGGWSVAKASPTHVKVRARSRRVRGHRAEIKTKGGKAPHQSQRPFKHGLRVYSNSNPTYAWATNNRTYFGMKQSKKTRYGIVRRAGHKGTRPSVTDLGWDQKLCYWLCVICCQKSTLTPEQQKSFQVRQYTHRENKCTNTAKDINFALIVKVATDQKIDILDIQETWRIFTQCL